MRLHLLAVPLTLISLCAAAWAEDAAPAATASPESPAPGGAAVAAASTAFGGADLLVGRTMKQPVTDKMFTVGIDVGAAPLDVGLSAGRDSVVNQAIAGVCGNALDPDGCRSLATSAIKSLGNVSEAQWESVSAAAGSSPELQAALENVGVSAANAEQIVKLADQRVSPESRRTLVDLVHKTQSGANILLDTFFDVNLAWVDVKVSIPFTIAHLDGETHVYMANVGLDAKTGYAWELGRVGVGLTGGVAMYFPSGHEGASAAQTADLFSSPKFAYGYLTVAPYVVAGVDFTWLTLQASAELDSMQGVRGNPDVSSVQFLRYGTGVVILPRLNPKWTVSAIGELNGLAPIRNAAPYDALFAVVGAQLRLHFLKLALAVQFPLVSHEEQLGQIGGVNFGSLAKYYVLTRVAFVF